jgi:Uncharacterized protein conserved in bacteria (DUF2330)
MVRRGLALIALTVTLVVVGGGAAFACGGLVAPGHAEVLERATTLSAWHAGFEHYVTGFRFAGSASSFGYIVPLPGVPMKIEKGGDWTLERLEREISPVLEAFASAAPAPLAADRVQVLQRVRVDALDIVVVRGGGPDVAAWAAKNGFDLTPDTPAVLKAYSDQGAVFALAKFDALDANARGLAEGQGTTIHFTIPLSAPWIPLRILALGKGDAELVDADLFVLTDRAPAMDPLFFTVGGMSLKHYGPASEALLADLRSDQGMEWVPAKMWFTALSLHTQARTVSYDLSIDGGGPPRPVLPAGPVSGDPAWTWWVVALVIVAGAGLGWRLWRAAEPTVRPAS